LERKLFNITLIAYHEYAPAINIRWD